MSETPDFERIADVCLARVYEVRSKGLIAEHNVVAEQLRQLWNARGAALIDPVTNAADEWVRAGAGTYDELHAVVEQAIKRLDR